MYEGGVGDPSEFLNMYLDDDYSTNKPMMMMGAGANAPPYDFLGAFDAITTSASSSSASSHSHSTGNSPNAFSMVTGESPLLSIDPALVGTPSSSSPENENDNDFGEHDDEDEGGEADGDEEADTVPEMITPIKVGGKGKARKGTVASGGINKKSSLGKENKETPTSLGVGGAGMGGNKVEDRDSDDWRPSPEEYKKMSSKEKRQLRNKISARNFRVRRKEYISTLEADISERDALISAIRSELGSSKSENVTLRQDIAALKRSLLTGRDSGG